MQSVDLSYFTVTDSHPGTLLPTDLATGLWSGDQIHGVAISAALARGMERDMTRTDLRPARWTVDLFRPSHTVPSTVETTVLRDGKRIALVESRFVQDGETTARANAVWLLPTEDPDGSVWSPEDVPAPPPLDLVAPLQGPSVPWLRSAEDWSQDFKEHQNAGRHQNWNYGVPVVLGEQPSPFQAAAAIADSTSMVCNWGSAGVQYINTDITLSLSRLPSGPELGLRAEHWSGHDGIAVGVCTVIDREGVIGQTMVTALTNARRTVDFGEHDFGADRERTSRA